MNKKYQKIQKIKKNYSNQLTDPDPGWPPKIQRAMTFIHTHLFDSRLNVRWMIEQCCLNGKSFATSFAIYVGMTPKQYILHHRLEMSKRLLKANSKKIHVTTIAISIGFKSLSSYSHTFKGKTDVTPSEWRGIN